MKRGASHVRRGGNERTYVGESALSGYERGGEHLRDYEKEELDSHMFKHAVLEHGTDSTKPNFEMKVVKAHLTALTRQVHEAVLIQRRRGKILNSKSEYNRCQLPRLSVKMGVKEMKKGGEEFELTEDELRAVL